MDDQFSYDRVVYPSYSFPQSNPDRLAVMATYYGMDPAEPGNCRVLELACGDGTNLLSFAYMFPQSSFVGIDLSERHIKDAQSAASQIGVGNTEFIHGDIMDLSRNGIGEFDFIIAHGLYSWVPDGVREKILSVYSECLAPNGVGYISYNVYPGCYLRRMIWEMLKYHTAGLTDPTTKVNSAVIFAGVLKELSPEDHVFRNIMEAELPKILDRAPENIYHDDLSEINNPFYFHEFAEQLERNGLQFLSEAEPYSMNVPDLSDDARQVLDALGGDIIRRQQYIDFFRCRRFRSSLVCRSSNDLDRNPGAEVLSKFYIASQIVPVGAGQRADDESKVEFEVPNGSSIATSHPLTKTALLQFTEEPFRWKKFDDIVAKTKLALADTPDHASASEVSKTAAWFLKMFDGGVLKFHKFQPTYLPAVSERPVASACARWQVQRGCASITTMSGTNLPLQDTFTLNVLTLLDGTRDRAALVADIKKSLRVEDTQQQAFEAQLPEMIDTVLLKLAESGYLIG